MSVVLGAAGAPAGPPGGLLPAGQVEEVLGGLRGFDPNGVIQLLDELSMSTLARDIEHLQVRGGGYGVCGGRRLFCARATTSLVVSLHA